MAGGAARAVGSGESETYGLLDERISDLTRTIEANRTTAEQAHKDLGLRMDGLAAAVGKPKEVDGGPSGLYKLVTDLTVDLDARVKPFESLRHQVRGGIKTAVPMLTVFGVVLWFLEGHRIAALFGVH